MKLLRTGHGEELHGDFCHALLADVVLCRPQFLYYNSVLTSHFGYTPGHTLSLVTGFSVHVRGKCKSALRSQPFIDQR